MRCSGHESFACRYAWLPKAVEALHSDPMALDDEDGAMVALGVGKNMVRSIRFWIQAFAVAQATNKGLGLTTFGKTVFGKRGLDPFLEDAKTLWLLHWHLSSDREDPLFAWDFVLSRWSKSEFTRTEIVAAATHALRGAEKPVSSVTLEQHFDIFLRTYSIPDADEGAFEDELDSPLAQIRLIEPMFAGAATKGRNLAYTIRIDEKPEVSAPMFAYCVDDYWRRHRPNEKTLSFRDIAFAPGGPGTVFRISEQGIRTRLESIDHDSDGILEYSESAATPMVSRTRNQPLLLGGIYAAT